ncbi:MAG: hypothetical protein R3D67_18160 [Hyphomicrobiaceae bacterium]
MASNFYESLEEKAIPLPSDRSTGLVLAAASLIATIVWWRTVPAVAATGLGIALLLASVAVLAPHLLRPLNIAWMGLATVLGRIVGPVAMAIMYLAAIIPFGLVMQYRSDPLRRRPNEAGESYWIVPEVTFGPNDMTRQF